MLLRRLTEHVQSQNWTAIGLDLVIVVLGVFMGVQLGNWNEGRSERADEINYLFRLHEDLSADHEMYGVRLQVLNRQIEVAPDAQSMDFSTEARAWITIRAQYTISGIFPPEIHNATYTDMVNSGRLSLILDEALRDQLVGHYAADAATPVLVSEPPFRQMVRGVIPHEIQAYLTSPDCQVDFVTYRACPPPVAEDLRSIAASLAADTELRRALNYNISHHRISREIILSLLSETEAMQLRVAEALRARGHEIPAG